MAVLNQDPLYFDDNLGTLENTFGIEFTVQVVGDKLEIDEVAVMDYETGNWIEDLSDEQIADVKERAAGRLASWNREAQAGLYEVDKGL